MEAYGLPSPQNDKTELQKELLRYDIREQKDIYERLCDSHPSTDEQQNVFDGVVSAVMNPSKDNRLHSLCGIAGSGKTTVAEKIATYLRSKGKIVLLCAATTLACQNYNSIGGAWTAHRLTKFPVLEDDDRDFEDNAQCRCVRTTILYSFINYFVYVIFHIRNVLYMELYIRLENTQRLELLQNCGLIIWDEFFSNHREILESLYTFLPESTIILCMGDGRQILPIVRGGAADTIAATFTSSPLWPQFRQWNLTKNMRILNSLASLTDDTSQAERERIQAEIDYAMIIQDIGEGNTGKYTYV